LDTALDIAEQERQAAGGKDVPIAVGNVLNAMVKFTQVEIYTTFLAEYAFVDGNIVVHFFPAKEAYVEVGGRHRVTEEALLHWQRVFPAVLSPTAEAYFHATLPIISAQYIPEMTSWYFRAGGFARRLQPEEFILRFFERLDDALDRVSSALATPA
jgi:hypothetical protein